MDTRFCPFAVVQKHSNEQKQMKNERYIYEFVVNNK